MMILRGWTASRRLDPGWVEMTMTRPRAAGPRDLCNRADARAVAFALNVGARR